jgi:hypothetical protein
MWTAVQQVSQQTRLQIGFENRRECDPGRIVANSSHYDVVFENLTPSQTLNKLLELRPGFDWRVIDGVAVVRPSERWVAMDSVLDRKASSFEASETDVHRLLHLALAATPQVSALAHEERETQSFQPNGVGLMHVRFPGGTLLQALNEITRPFGGTWEVGYTTGVAHIVLRSIDAFQGSTLISVATEQ